MTQIANLCQPNKIMNKQQLFENIKRKRSFLCVGLDTDIQKTPCWREFAIRACVSDNIKT